MAARGATSASHRRETRSRVSAGRAGDGAADIAERDDLRYSVDRQPDRGEAKPPARQRLAVAEAGRGDVDAADQDPASSAGKAATAAMARSVVPTAAAAPSMAAFAARL